jgi:putative nucleotidyltransferase with HDIG domain
MTANILRLVNSSVFGLSRSVTSVRQAVALLGMRRVLETATSVSMLRFVPQTLPGYGVDARTYWQHCAATAVLSEELVGELKLPTQELAFTAGLLHDVGKLAIASYLLTDPKWKTARFDAYADTFLEAEELALGTTHAAVGAMLAIRWQLPEPLVWVARWHHRPESGGDAAPSVLLDVVHLADGLAHMLGYGADVGELSRHISVEAANRLGVKVRRLESVAAASAPKIKALGEVFVNRAG